MNLGTFIVGVIAVGICVLPFVLMVGGRKKKEKKLLLSVSAIAKEHNCKISQYEFCDEFVIGLDEIANFLFFFRNSNIKEMSEQINLAEIKTCKMKRTGHYDNNREGGNSTIEKLELQLSYIDKNKTDLLLPFFNEEEDVQMNGEIQVIEKWNEIVNKRLKP
ncbi:MAG: hypothetical protein WC389_09460 [Lutibacter sp.]|jgi:hypothetical protein